MMRTFRTAYPWCLGAVVAALLSSCTINRDIMFKTPMDYEFDTFHGFGPSERS
jgi:hypothetical protein